MYESTEYASDHLLGRGCWPLSQRRRLSEHPLSQDPFCVPGHRPGHQVNAVPQLQLHQRIVKNRFLALHFICQIHISKVPLIEIYDPSCVQGSCGKNRPTGLFQSNAVSTCANLSSTIPQMEMKISQKTHVRVFYINSWG